VILLLLLMLLEALPLGAQRRPRVHFEVQEATIAQVHSAMNAGRLTCRELVSQYLRRIDAYDKKGPAINSIVIVNTQAGKQAEELDRHFAAVGLTGALHCVPVIVKDNIETRGLQTANGSLSLAGYVPLRDAFQVRRVLEAGALVLAKSNMAEWAFSPYETVSSILPGYTKNPYSLDRVTAGSSGGTAAAVAASFGLVGLGSDTGNSIRGPAAHQALVGIRSTMGLTSRGGVIPLADAADIAGPMTRTVEDAARVFSVVVGEDRDDPVTAVSRGREKPNYLAGLDRGGLKGKTIGILRQAYERETTDPEVVKVFEAAVDVLRRSGAKIVDPAKVELEEVRRSPGAAPCMGFKYSVNRYLASRGEDVPVRNLTEVVKGGKFHPSVQRRLEMADKDPENGPGSAACAADSAYRDKVRAAVLATMDQLSLDAFVYPTWSNPPRLIGDLNTPHGDNSQLFSPTTGFPAVNVPMGYTRAGRLPAGMTIYGRPWSEALLLKMAYAYEQATRHRHPPASTPVLR
jgi:Asp-tRNA(Asn)/Glu-tRNA(Gln) amidotransferase A subunit family amidase